MKNRILIVLCFLWSLGGVSCINDDSALGSLGIPELSIAGSESTTMPIVNFNLGDLCIITPDISYQGGDETALKYEWSIGTYQSGTKGALEVVSNERNLEYHFETGGTYYAHLNVTDGKVGQSIDYQVNINRTFENGYILVSNDEAGKGNLAFVKIMTPEETEAGIEQIYVEHSLEKMNSGMTEKKLINALYGKITWPTTIHRILVSDEERCYFLDPNTFTIIAELKYEEVYPGFKATRFIPDGYSPYAYDDAMDKFVHLNLQYMFSFEYSYYEGHAFDDFFIGSYKYYGSTNVMPLFVNYSTSEVFDFNSNYGTFGSTGDLLTNEDVLTAFIGKPDPYSPKANILSRSKTEPEKGYLYAIKNISSMNNSGAEDIKKLEFAITDETAIPVAGTKFVFSPTYNRHFYPIKNQIYVCLAGSDNPLPKKSEYAINYPENEVITFLDVNLDTEELYVATYDQTNKRGNFYIYNTEDVRTDNQGNVSPKAAHKNCADRITGILYKPSI